MERELTVASWLSLEPSRRASVFSQVMTRADQVLSTANIRHLQEEPLDAFLPGAIEAMRRKLEPAGEQAAKEAVSLACQILRCKFPAEDVLAGYVAVLAEFPRDLLMPSIKEAIAKETHHVLPTPGALLNDARPRRNERKETLSRAELALKRLRIAREWESKKLGSC